MTSASPQYVDTDDFDTGHVVPDGINFTSNGLHMELIWHVNDLDVNQPFTEYWWYFERVDDYAWFRFTCFMEGTGVGFTVDCTHTVAEADPDPLPLLDGEVYTHQNILAFHRLVRTWNPPCTVLVTTWTAPTIC